MSGLAFVQGLLGRVGRAPCLAHGGGGSECWHVVGQRLEPFLEALGPWPVPGATLNHSELPGVPEARGVWIAAGVLGLRSCLVCWSGWGRGVLSGQRWQEDCITDPRPPTPPPGLSPRRDSSAQAPPASPRAEGPSGYGPPAHAGFAAGASGGARDTCRPSRRASPRHWVPSDAGV